ncbi:MAG: Tetratricopeptide repeat protein [Candidatus Poribacteria bacterium]|nr:Tetratricopeptide repeat protein [Candidatus Poribacteria bacterium]
MVIRICVFIITLILLIFNTGCSTISTLNAWRLEKYSDPAETVLRYHEIAENDPKSPDAPKALLKAGDLYYGKLNRKSRAIEVYNSIIKDYPGTKEAFIASEKLGWHYFNTREYQKSQEIMFRLFNDHSNGEIGTEAQWTLSQSYEKISDYRHAASSYYAFAILHSDDKRAVDALLLAGDIYKNRLKRESKAGDVYRLIVRVYGRDYSKAGKVWSATRDLQAMRMEVPEPNEIQQQQQLSELRKPVHKERTDKFADMTKKHEAELVEHSIFDSVDVDTILKNTMDVGLEADQIGDSSIPDNTILTLANVYYMSLDYLKAGAFYHKLELKDSADPMVYWNLGNCYTKLGMVYKAKEYQEKALEMSPSMFDKALRNAEHEYFIQDYPESLDILEQIEIIAPVHSRGRTYYDMGLSYRKLNDLDNALISFEKSYAFDPTPENKDSAQHIAEILYYNRRNAVNVDRAVIYQDIVEDKVRSFKVQLEIAEQCFKYGSYKWARSKYKFAADLAPDKETELSMQVKSIIATARYGDISLAKLELSQLQEKYGDNPIISQGLAEIEIKANNDSKEIKENKKKDLPPPITKVQIQKRTFIFNILTNFLILLISIP